MSSEAIGIWIILACTVVLALCALLELLLKILEKRSKIRTQTKERVSPLLFKVVVVVLVITVVALFLDKLNLPVVLGEVVKKECKVIAKDAKKDVLKDVRECNQKVITTLADSEALRKRVYRDALDQAMMDLEKGYVTFVEGYYITSYDRREENRLLTEKQRTLIENCFDKCKDECNKEDQFSLMCCVLNDQQVIKELKREGKSARLSPYDRIAVAGGYIGELMLKHTRKLRIQLSKSALF